MGTKKHEINLTIHQAEMIEKRRQLGEDFELAFERRIEDVWQYFLKPPVEIWEQVYLTVLVRGAIMERIFNCYERRNCGAIVRDHYRTYVGKLLPCRGETQLLAALDTFDHLRKFNYT